MKTFTYLSTLTISKNYYYDHEHFFIQQHFKYKLTVQIINVFKVQE